MADQTTHDPSPARGSPQGSSANGSAANGSARPPPPAAAAAKRRPTRIASIRTGLIAGALALILLVIFVLQNTQSVQVSFLGAHARLSLAIALVIAAIAGALVIAVAGTARIMQLRRNIRRSGRQPDPGSPASGSAAPPTAAR